MKNLNFFKKDLSDNIVTNIVVNQIRENKLSWFEFYAELNQLNYFSTHELYSTWKEKDWNFWNSREVHFLKQENEKIILKAYEKYHMILNILKAKKICF